MTSENSGRNGMTMNKTSAKKREFPIYILLIYLLVCAVMTSGVTLAKYTTSSGDVSDSARVASYVFEITDGAGDNAFGVLTDMCKPGDVAYYPILINNFSQENGVTTTVCEVAQTYTVEITLGGSLPIRADLYEGEVNDGNVNSSPVLSSVTTQNNSMTCSSSWNMMAAVEVSHRYTLVVSWPLSDNGLQYSRGGISEVEVSVISTQID